MPVGPCIEGEGLSLGHCIVEAVQYTMGTGRIGPSCGQRDTTENLTFPQLR